MLEVRNNGQGTYAMLMSDKPLPAVESTPHFMLVDGKAPLFDDPVEGSAAMTLVDVG